MTTSPKWMRTWGKSLATADAVVAAFPTGSRGASMYRTWQKQFGPSVAVVGMQLPGREERIDEAPLLRVRDVAEGAAEALATLGDRPLILTGACAGATAALETAALMGSAGRWPDRLVVANARPPHFVGSWGDETVPQGMELLRQNDEELIVTLVGSCPLIGIESLEDAKLLDPATLSGILDTFRGVVRMTCEYNYEHGPLACDVVAWRGVDDTEVRPEHNDGWDRYTSGRFSTEEFPGVHECYELGEPPVVAAFRRLVDEIAVGVGR